MSDFVSALSTLFSFLFDQLSYVANFFTSNLLGQIILGVTLFYLAFGIITSFLGIFKK